MNIKRGVLLDVDGTLVDSNDAHAETWRQALSDHHHDVPFEAIRKLIGMGGDKLLPKVAGIDAESPEGKAISDRRGELFLTRHLPALQPFAGVRELLSRMKQDGLLLVVASSAKEDELKALLELCGADEFVEDSTSSDDADRSKPDPDIVREALKTIGLPADEVVMIGDTPYDVEAASRAGVEIIGFRCGGWHDAALDGAIAIYDGPGDLLNQYESSVLFREPGQLRMNQLEDR